MSGTPAPAAGGPHHEPPLTNRGVLRPDDRDQGGIDYLKLTAWAEPEEVRQVLAGGVLDRYGWSVDPFDQTHDWTEKAIGGRASRILDSGCLSVIEYLEEVTQKDMFCSVEVKGTGCAHLGNGGLLQMLTELRSRFRVRASRVDVMAHTEHFEPATAHQAIQSGNYNSRTDLGTKFAFTTSPEGDTLYLGVVSKPSGGMKRSGDRLIRIYNRRGPTRVELQMVNAYAHGSGSQLFHTPLDEWPALIRGMIRDYCDFVDAASDSRITRCTMLPWWAAFVEGSEKISVRPQDDPMTGTIVGQVDGILQRFAGKLFAAKEAYGRDWIIQRIERHGKLRRDKINDHEDTVRELLRYKGTGWAGIPDHEDEVPF